MENDLTDGFADISQDENSDIEDNISLNSPEKRDGKVSGTCESGDVSENGSEETEVSLDSESTSNVGDNFVDTVQSVHNDEKSGLTLGQSQNRTNVGNTNRTAVATSNQSSHKHHKFRTKKSDIRIQLSKKERIDSSSTLDGLLCEIYDRCHPVGGISRLSGSADSDGFTEYSSNSEGTYLSSKGDSFQEKTRIPRAILQAKGIVRTPRMTSPAMKHP